MCLHFVCICLSVNKSNHEAETSTKLLYISGKKQPGKGTLLMRLQGDKLKPETGHVRLSFNMSI